MTNKELEERWETTIIETKKICEIKLEKDILESENCVEETIYDIDNEQD